MYGGTLKCGQANVPGHERMMYGAYAEIYGYHMYEQSFPYLIKVNRS